MRVGVGLADQKLVHLVVDLHEGVVQRADFQVEFNWIKRVAPHYFEHGGFVDLFFYEVSLLCGFDAEVDHGEDQCVDAVIHLDASNP